MENGLDVERGDSEDEIVDFANASLYLSAIQTILSVMACAATAILACWILPPTMVSAVRTLTLTCLVGGLSMRAPLRIGHVHGLKLVFSALRPAVAVYIVSLVMETLLHTCTQQPDEVPSWRRVIFHLAVIGMTTSGIWRARHPLSKTDAPFLLTSASLMVVAVLPPPAVSMQGPLCQSVSFLGAAERMVRALVFSSVYTLFVYISSPSTSQYGGTVVCIMRASAASVWILGVPLAFMPMVFIQCAIAIWARLHSEGYDASARPLVHGKHINIRSSGAYDELPTRTPPHRDDVECNVECRGDAHDSSIDTPDHVFKTQQISAPVGTLPRTAGPLMFRPVDPPSHSTSLQGPPSKQRMAEIAACIPEE